jgi:hypothetical protein
LVEVDAVARDTELLLKPLNKPGEVLELSI